MYARLQIFTQLSPTLTKLCHIKRDYLYDAPIHSVQTDRQIDDDRETRNTVA